jgi:hypothetical protein
MPIKFLEVSYEKTVADMEAMARKMIDFIGLDWDPACLKFHQTERAVRTASLSQVRQPIYGGSVQRWHRYEKALGPLFQALTHDATASGSSSINTPTVGI